MADFFFKKASEKCLERQGTPYENAKAATRFSEEIVQVQLGIGGIHLSIASRYSYGATTLTADDAEALANALQGHAAAMRSVNGAVEGHQTEWTLTR